MTGEPIHFPVDQPSTEATLVYRPWGSRTLKVAVSTAVPLPPLRLRPKNIRSADTQAGLFRAFADDSNALIVNWGGGHEPGPCVKAQDFLLALEKCVSLEPGTRSMIFLNLRHAGPDVPEAATVTLEAFEEASGRVVATLPIRLQKPAAYPANAVQFIQAKPGCWQPVGEALPQYDPRWWPGPVNYSSAASLPLTLQVVGADLLVQWRDQVVATITDHTRPSVLTPETMFFELFDFDPWHLALRISFFWLDKNVRGSHEVPDSERFDLLIRKRDGRVTLACTDLHWREVWGEVDEGPLRATIGLSQQFKLKLVQEGVGKLWSVLRREKGKDHERVYNPVERYIRRKAETLGQTTEEPVRGKGFEAHVPSLLNVLQSDELPPRMTSSDVRLG